MDIADQVESLEYALGYAPEVADSLREAAAELEED